MKKKKHFTPSGEFYWNVTVAINVKGLSARDAYDEIQKIREEEPGLPQGSVWTRAQSPDSPLHNVFEWDAKKAHIRYLNHQERCLIGSIMVEFTNDEGEKRSVRAFQYVEVERVENFDNTRFQPLLGSRFSGYVNLSDTASDIALHQSTVDLAEFHLNGWRARLENIAGMEAAANALGVAIREIRSARGVKNAV